PMLASEPASGVSITTVGAPLTAPLEDDDPPARGVAVVGRRVSHPATNATAPARAARILILERIIYSDDSGHEPDQGRLESGVPPSSLMWGVLKMSRSRLVSVRLVTPKRWPMIGRSMRIGRPERLRFAVVCVSPPT